MTVDNDITIFRGDEEIFWKWWRGFTTVDAIWGVKFPDWVDSEYSLGTVKEEFSREELEIVAQNLTKELEQSKNDRDKERISIAITAVEHALDLKIQDLSHKVVIYHAS